MSRPEFKIIDGGLSEPVSKHKKLFISAYVTDTRLMGVIVVGIRWKLEVNFAETGYYQFFYFDCEEFGFETYKSIVSDDINAVSFVEKTLISGLGGKKAAINKRQAFYLVKKYAAFNKEHNIGLPEGKDEYGFILCSNMILTEEQLTALNKAQYGRIATNYQAINYFMMRIFGKDFSAAAYLCEDGIIPYAYKNIYFDIPIATLHKNTIDKKAVNEAESQGQSYLCESLIEYEEKMMLVISEVSVKNLKITSFKGCSGFSISRAEAGMMLSKSEFVTQYELMIPPEEAATNLLLHMENAMVSRYENGRLLMLFNKNNNHVGSREFRLNNDVLGLYYITDTDQLIAAAYNMQNIRTLEQTLRKSSLAPHVVTVSKFEFKDPVLYEFMESAFDDFNDFLDVIIDKD